MKNAHIYLLLTLIPVSFGAKSNTSYDYESIGKQFKEQFEKTSLSKSQLISSLTNNATTIKSNGLLDDTEAMIASLTRLESLLKPQMRLSNYRLGMMVVDSLASNNSCSMNTGYKYLTFDSILYKCSESSILKEFDINQQYEDILIKTKSPIQGYDFFGSYQSGELDKINAKVSSLKNQIYALPSPSLIKRTTFSSNKHRFKLGDQT
ncbi:hypothetical protein QTV49_001851 [Vibrio vulnificus]|nr:hypothetical protein [Vibrio vulnificus]